MAGLRKVSQSSGFAPSFNLVPKQMLWRACFYVTLEILKDFHTEFATCAGFRARRYGQSFIVAIQGSNWGQIADQVAFSINTTRFGNNL